MKPKGLEERRTRLAANGYTVEANGHGFKVSVGRETIAELKVADSADGYLPVYKEDALWYAETNLARRRVAAETDMRVTGDPCPLCHAPLGPVTFPYRLTEPTLRRIGCTECRCYQIDTIFGNVFTGVERR